GRHAGCGAGRRPDPRVRAGHEGGRGAEDALVHDPRLPDLRGDRAQGRRPLSAQPAHPTREAALRLALPPRTARVSSRARWIALALLLAALFVAVRLLPVDEWLRAFQHRVAG